MQLPELLECDVILAKPMPYRLQRNLVRLLGAAMNVDTPRVGVWAMNSGDMQ